jgi:cold shock CspA family protein
MRTSGSQPLSRGGSANEKGFGFISQSAGEDVFVHHTAIQGHGYHSLEDDQQVDFDVQQDPLAAGSATRGPACSAEVIRRAPYRRTYGSASKGGPGWR